MGARDGDRLPVRAKKYPRGMHSADQYGGQYLMVWTAPDAEGGETHHMAWEPGHTAVKVRRMTDPGTYRVSNWDHSQSGTPAAYEDVAELPATTAGAAVKAMEDYARDVLGVVEYAR